MRSLLLIGPALAVLAGCQTTSESPTFSAPSNYRDVVASHYRQALKDPYSVRDAGISRPRQEFAGLIWGGMREGVCVRFNSKNSFGAYIGLTTSLVIFRDGKVQFSTSTPAGCGSDVVFEPFVELEQPRNINAPSARPGG